jgi:hypothetical protein
MISVLIVIDIARKYIDLNRFIDNKKKNIDAVGFDVYRRRISK